jgi:hypothetical protein
MIPGMAGAGSGNDRGKKRIGYTVQHIDTPEGPPDPGWGALAGSNETLPPVEDDEDDKW